MEIFLMVVYCLAYNAPMLLPLAIALVLVRFHKRGRWLFNVGVILRILGACGFVAGVIRNQNLWLNIEQLIGNLSSIPFAIGGHFWLRGMEKKHLQ